MSPFSYSILFLILSLLQLSAVLGAGKEELPAVSGGGGEVSGVKGVGRRLLVGGWQPILDLKNKNVVEIGEFAVEEHNKKANSKLMFGGVLKGEQQVVSGMNYRLHIAAKDGGSLGKYVAVVYDKPWEKLRSLKSFKKVV